MVNFQIWRGRPLVMDGRRVCLPKRIKQWRGAVLDSLRQQVQDCQGIWAKSRRHPKLNQSLRSCICQFRPIPNWRNWMSVNIQQNKNMCHFKIILWPKSMINWLSKNLSWNWDFTITKSQFRIQNMKMWKTDVEARRTGISKRRSDRENRWREQWNRKQDQKIKYYKK